ncbi:MAG TPA: alpha/beta hydrolase [Cyclobacteriaceae bacterium]|jgi:pimeloyl-ACP methyl ester carboxylesterase
MNVYSERSIALPGSVLSYYVAGSGNLPLVAFHGFGQTHKAFYSWLDAVGSQYRLILVDLYFHGKSTWDDPDTPLEKNTWKEVMSTLFAREGISTCSVAGFSLGGKFALATFEAFPGQVRALYLIAADGIRPSFWYTLATWPLPMRALFRSLISHEKRFTKLTRVAKALGLADKKVLRFAENQMDTPARRERVYNTWVVLRRLKFDMSHLTRMMEAYDTRVVVITGRYDRIIPPHRVEPVFKRLKNATFHVLETGHNSLLPAAASLISE